jgi:hypothetical protein
VRRNATLIGLAVVLALLAGLALLDRTRPSSDQAAHTRRRILPDFVRAQASHIELARRDGRKVTLVHEATGWWLAEPRRRADDDAVEALLAVLEFGQVERRATVADAEARKRFGLDPPLVTISVGAHVLRVGEDGPVHGVYLLRDDDREVLVAEHRLVEVADRDPQLWLSLRVTLSDPLAARQLATDTWTLTRERGWRVTRPMSARASDGKVDALLQSLVRVRAQRATSLPAVRGVPLLALDGTVEAWNAQPQQPASCQQLILRADQTQLCFARSDFDTLRAPVNTLYERHLFPLRLDDVRALDIAVAGQELALRREEGVWRIVAPRRESGPASDDKVRAIVRALVEAEARGFVSEAPRGALVRVRVASADDDVSAMLAAAGGVGLGRREDETVTLEIDPALVARLAATTAAELRREGDAR